MFINNTFDIGDIVYLKTEPEQRRYMVVAILINGPDRLQYKVNCGTFEWWAYPCELSDEPNILLKVTS